MNFEKVFIREQWMAYLLDYKQSLFSFGSLSEKKKKEENMRSHTAQLIN